MSGSEPEAHVPLPGVWEAPLISKEWHDNWEGFIGLLCTTIIRQCDALRIQCFLRWWMRCSRLGRSRRKTSKNVTLRDVHNMVARMREGCRGNTTVEQRLESLLRGRRGNRSSVFVDDDEHGRCDKAFPEVMLVDATHNTNESRYKLFSFMIHDVYDHGQYVQHSLMENESAECLSDAISQEPKQKHCHLIYMHTKSGL
ncbi:LOW QUALITY PROTEIN: ABC transporter [Phytophthora megakarya]|uniref:ABC transporter n=1 Tax=Phytophthora megakarya TaxID=4795 RepID=A0A225V759_9STRA|nr:LOW QUALITY PROTEIN: ABC transporter [Phytophthora megakarya]